MSSRPTAELVEFGSGPALVLVPGIQGRWQYVRPAAESLSASFRVITFPLCGERTAGLPFDSARGFDNFVDQIEGVLAAAHVAQAIVCGISFGGLIALRFAAAHPERTSALILASTPGPTWHLRPRHARYARMPHVFGPVFALETPWRLRDEIRAAFAHSAARRRFARSQVRTLFEAPISLSAMAARALMIGSADHAAIAERIAVPTLVVTGEAALDHVVPVDGSADYARIITGARREVIAGTGHLGTITRPDVFARIIQQFLAQRGQSGRCSEVA